MTSAKPWESGFIGRQPELAVLTSALEDMLSGRGRMVMLAGEPGIGKTRLAQELTSRAESLGAQVLWGWCYEHVGAPPYWPYVHPIRSYIEHAGTENDGVARLESQMGPGAAAIAEIVPELNAKLPGLVQPPASDPGQARFRLFDSVTTFLKNASYDQPLVFVMDDLHWADSSSLLLLEFLVREISACPMLILGTYRDVEVSGTHPLSQTLGNLVRERHYQRVQLGGLTQEEVGEFVEGSKGVDLPNDVLETIHSRTEGNPLFVNEVVELIDPEQIKENRAWADIIPAGVRDAIGSRLSRMSADCNQVLGTASVIGREFDLSLLRSLDSGAGADQVLAALDEALEAKVIEALPTASGRYQFGHALIQQVLYGELSSIRRLRAHASIGATLEQMHQTNLEPYAAGLAHHYAEAESLTGPEKLARYTLMAGERALATYAYEDALTHFQKGLVSRDITPSGTNAAIDEETADLLFGLARVQAAIFERHQVVEAFTTLSRAFAYYAEAGNVDQAVAAAVFPIAPAGVLIPGMTQLMAHALTLVPPDSLEAGRILSRYGGILGAAEGDYEGAQKALQQAISIARREKDVPLELQTLTNLSDVSGRNLRWQESIDNGVRAIGLLTGEENPYFEVLSRYFTAISLLHLGDPEPAREHALALQKLAERRVSGVLASLSLGPVVYLSCLQGDWATGRRFSDRGLEMASLDPVLLLPRLLLEYETGESAMGEFYLDRLLEAMRRSDAGRVRASGRVSLAIAMIARITGGADRFDLAASAAEAILSEPYLLPQDAMHARAGLALLAVGKGDRSAAEEHHCFLLQMKGTLTSSVASIDRILGLLSRTLGDHDQAVSHFEDAEAFCRKAGYLPQLAWTCCEFAETLTARSGTGDGARAASLLEESLAISSDLGMHPLIDRVTAQRKSAESQPSRAPAFPDGLTQREVEVLRQICNGKTDREIGEELFISVNTASNHVRNILNKTGAANRTEAAIYAARNGIAADATPG